MSTDTISVSAYLDHLNLTLKTERAKIVGEITGLQMYEGRTYLYFSLKDSVDQSTIKCFMWKNDYRLSGVTLTDGMEVVVSAYPNIYKPNGGMTLRVSLVELVGEGALKVAYDALKLKLETEGLLSDMRKRPIPEYPHRIGIITSKSGAVINDFLTNIGKYGFELLMVDSKVEGQDAITDLLSAIKTLKNKEIDVLVIMRGGGSLESFQAFNNEALVRAVADFPVPVLTGIGHDKDAPLVSLVSDCNVSTPTAVTHILNNSWDEARAHIQMYEQKIFSSYESTLREKKFQIENAVVLMETKFSSLFSVVRGMEQGILHGLSRIESTIHYMHELLVRSGDDLIRGYERQIDSCGEILIRSEGILELSNPTRQLARGYSIVKGKNGAIVRKKSDVTADDSLDIMVSDGIIHTQVI